MLGLFLWSSTPVQAAYLTDVADSFDYANNNKFDFRFRVAYEFFQESATIARENGISTGVSNQFFEYQPEFVVNHARHSLVLNPVIGIFRDFELGLRIPLIFSETFSSSPADAAKNKSSSLLDDGIVKNPNIDTTHGGLSENLLGDMSLYLNLGILNDYKGHWVTLVLGMDWTIPTGIVWDPRDPRNKTTGGGAGRGAHFLKWHITMSKRIHRHFDAYIQIWYRLGITPQSTLEGLVNPEWRQYNEKFKSQKTNVNEAAKEEAFRKDLVTRGIARSLDPSQSGGFMMGTEIVFYEKPLKHQKVSLDLRFFWNAFFEGRDYTMFTDMLAGYLPVNKKRDANGQIINEPLRASSLTDREQYYTIGGQFALHFMIGKFGWIRLQGTITHTLPFFLTQAKRGVDQDGNGFVNLGTSEEYPYHLREIDGVGKRIQQRDHFGFAFQLSGGLTF
jgi:hypothetical protein